MSFQSVELEDAWQRIRWNSDEVRQSDLCICLACEEYFAPSKVAWRLLDGRAGEGLSAAPLSDMTALCPSCKQPSVLGDASGFPIQNSTFVAAMADYVVRMKYAYDQ